MTRVLSRDGKSWRQDHSIFNCNLGLENPDDTLRFLFLTKPAWFPFSPSPYPHWEKRQHQREREREKKKRFLHTTFTIQTKFVSRRQSHTGTYLYSNLGPSYLTLPSKQATTPARSRKASTPTQLSSSPRFFFLRSTPSTTRQNDIAGKAQPWRWLDRQEWWRGGNGDSDWWKRVWKKIGQKIG